MMQIEDMKEAIVENEMEYVREIVFKNKWDELFDYIYTHTYSNFKGIDDKDIIELYTDMYGDIDDDLNRKDRLHLRSNQRNAMGY